MNPESVGLEMAWRLRGPIGQVVQCTIRRSEEGFVVQVGQTATDITRTCIVANVKRARRKADEWRTALLSLSEFAELDR
jgi:hypothetical protein